ncbi:hypothetical protein [Staphylococcus phage vB_SauM-V1SA09]|nr:hypothetical protein [Staphylococcus phage vB_ScaM-V1SC01]WOZ17299.1 hypothetical protein [Staphylococcus phage vB_SauM-V1SA09]WPF67576.1 hypothetical protein [Staphylococcus phage vB_SauM-V1SA12]
MRDKRIHSELLYDIIGKYIQEEENITPYIEAIYVDMMNIIVVEYTFYNENGTRMLGQYPIGEVM